VLVVRSAWVACRSTGSSPPKARFSAQHGQRCKDSLRSLSTPAVIGCSLINGLQISVLATGSASRRIVFSFKVQRPGDRKRAAEVRFFACSAGSG
jgi:hypothetical protein